VIYSEKPWLKSYDEGMPAEVPIPNTSLVDHFRSVMREMAPRPALRFLGVTLPYRALDHLSDRFAAALASHGLKKGDVVGINLPNTPQYLVAQLGVFKAGCAATGVSPLLTPAEAASQLADCKARALVTLDAIFEHRLLKILPELSDLTLVIGTPILEFLPSYKRLLAKLLKKVPTGKLSPFTGKRVVGFREFIRDAPELPPQVTVEPDDACLVQYTGGTTGTPKGTIITDRNLVAELTIVTTWLEMRRGREVILSGFPMFHVAGLALALGCVFQGHTQILVPDPRNTSLIISQIRKFRPTILVNVPSLYMMLLETPGFKDLDFRKLSFCLCAASPFPAEAMRELEAVIGENKVIEAYGMTELSSLATSNPRHGARKIGSVGVPLPNTKLRLVDLDTGETDVPPGAEGEIVVCGPQVMKGYLNRPEETAHALRERGGELWLHTGDVARMDEDGYFTIVDRSKDMLNVGGYKVFSREVEEKLYAHPAIEFCAIVGTPNPKRPGTDIVKLVVQLKEEHRKRPNDEITQEIIEFARERLAPYKIPKQVEILESMPLTPVGKVDKKALR
jgi:acyl-CoA synthetase (AMP-forming)/AMP-acid ligase II